MLESPTEPEAGARKKRANELIRHGLPRLDPNEPIAFLCECTRGDCYRTVWLTGLAYDRLHARARRRMIARGHRRVKVGG